MKFCLLLIFLVFVSPSLSAKRYWLSELINRSLYLNNGVAYISSPQLAEHCSYSRGQINMDGTEFNKTQYAYALSSKAKDKKLKYVVDSDHTTCVITGL